jgi:ADP-ribose pyrophosphatase
VSLALCAGLVSGTLTAVRQGLSGANMKLCVVRISLADDAAEPVAKPEEGEFIEKHLVPLKQLYRTLKGASLRAAPQTCCMHSPC